LEAQLHAAEPQVQAEPQLQVLLLSVLVQAKLALYCLPVAPLFQAQGRQLSLLCSTCWLKGAALSGMVP
jgi:hypothetical protein